MNNRERILDTALRLFNDTGTGPVSTNHIAEALGISPGNLYYHFRNKEEIIRALFERMFTLWGQPSSLPQDRAPTLADLEQVVRASYVLLWDYRFVYRELIALLRRDEVLRQRWLAVRSRGFEGFYELFDTFVRAGVLRPPQDPTALSRLAELCWLISEFWLPSLEVSGEAVDVSQMERGVELMLQALEPYIIRL